MGAIFFCRRKWAFYSENRGAQPGRETVGKMALWIGASSVGHNPAAALGRGIPRDETVYPCMVRALRTRRFTRVWLGRFGRSPRREGFLASRWSAKLSAHFLVGVVNDATVGLLQAEIEAQTRVSARGPLF